MATAGSAAGTSGTASAAGAFEADSLFSTIQGWHGARPSRSILDAGTGDHSLVRRLHGDTHVACPQRHAPLSSTGNAALRQPTCRALPAADVAAVPGEREHHSGDRRRAARRSGDYRPLRSARAACPHTSREDWADATSRGHANATTAILRRWAHCLHSQKRCQWRSHTDGSFVGLSVGVGAALQMRKRFSAKLRAPDRIIAGDWADAKSALCHGEVPSSLLPFLFSLEWHAHVTRCPDLPAIAPAQPVPRAYQVYDVVLADYLLGAVDVFTPYFQTSMFRRLRPHVGACSCHDQTEFKKSDGGLTSLPRAAAVGRACSAQSHPHASGP